MNKIINAAKAYFEGNPELWVSIVNEVATTTLRVIHQDISNQPDYDPNVDYCGLEIDGEYEQIKEDLSLKIHTLLLDPVKVRDIAYSKNRDPLLSIIESTKVLVESDYYEITDSHHESEDVVDYTLWGDGQFSVTREDDDEGEYEEESEFATQFYVSQFRLNEEKILPILSSRLQSNIKSKADGFEIYRLNEIDIELYNALIKNPKLFGTLDWRVFEKLLADILETLGYEIELQQGTKDGGIDLFAIKSDETLGKHRYLLQAKRWGNKVGVDPVRQLLFLHNDLRVTKSCLATTSRFTRGAWDLADQYKWQLELKDRDEILNWLKKARAIKK